MRLRVVCLPVLALLALPAGALADTGGASAPDSTGGAQLGQPVKTAHKRPAKRATARVRPLTATVFAVTPGTVQVGGPPATFAIKVTGSARSVRLRVDLVRAGVVAKRIHFGYKPTNVLYAPTWAPAGGELAAGTYLARLHATDAAGHVLRRTAVASGRSRLEITVQPAAAVGNGIFPVQGKFDFGGDDARFGAQRAGHIHQGQDVIAAEGTPLVSPEPGVVYFTGNQDGGAGVYLVIRGDDGRDLVFMHLQDGSLVLEKGDRVTQGQQIGLVGHTGDAEGPHLHFELWPDGWYAKGSQPVDPLPQLQAWAAASPKR
jgi:murein DD-endopeptidase MepM/ murein hydrolase activator NlpD